MLFNSDIKIPFTPREFQNSGFKSIISHKPNLLIIAPPGAGKTFLMLMIAKYYVEMGKRVLISVHMIAILNQMIEHATMWGFNFGVIQANHRLTFECAPLQLASTSTLIKRDFRPFDIVICDEIHFLSKGMHSILISTRAQVLGFSATPFNPGLKTIFGDNILNLATAKELTELGVLVPLRILSGRKINLNKLTKDSYGEFSAESIEAASREILGDAVKTWKEFAYGEQTLVFGSSISHAQIIANAFNDQNIPAAVYCANTTTGNRLQYIKDFKSGKIKVLCSVSAISTGFDAPEATVMLDMRPLRRSFSTLVQSVGRILRSAPDKPHATLIDCTGNIKRMATDYINLFLHGVSSLKNAEKQDKKIQDKEESQIEESPLKACPKCNSVGLWLKTTCLACGYVSPPKFGNIRVVRENIEFKEIDLFSVARQGQTNMQLWSAICANVFTNTHPHYYDPIKAEKKSKALYYTLTGSWPRYGEQFITNGIPNLEVNAKIQVHNQAWKDKVKSEILIKGTQ